MFIVESLGEHLYNALCSKSSDTNLKSIYRILAQNEKQTRDRIEKEITFINMPAPMVRVRCLTNIANMVFWMLPEQRLLKLLTKILKRRMFSKWHKKYNDQNVDLWGQLLEHENLQHKMLNLTE